MKLISKVIIFITLLIVVGTIIFFLISDLSVQSTIQKIIQTKPEITQIKPGSEPIKYYVS